MKTFWLSFAGGEGNRGVAIIDAPCLEDAYCKAKKALWYPGGEVAGFEMPSEADNETQQWGKDRLISKSELAAAGYTTTDDMSEDEKKKMQSHPGFGFICEDHE